jgi:hypothetical protein
MMANALDLIFEVIDEVNGQLPPDSRLEKAPETVVVGEGGVLDSLGVTNFLITLEEKVSTASGQSISLLRDDFLSGEDDTLRTVATINEYILNSI